MKIVLIGSGNVASQLGVALKQSGQIILQVYSRQVEHANELAERLGCDAIDKFSSLTLHADLYLICVSDQAIEEIILQLPKGLSGVVAHTSGSTALSIFLSPAIQVGMGSSILYKLLAKPKLLISKPFHWRWKPVIPKPIRFCPALQSC